MDPYLETADLWPLFQRAMVDTLRDNIQRIVDSSYDAQVFERRYIAGAEQVEPFVAIVRPPEGRGVTLVDMVSPANKTTAAGRDACLATRREARAAGANVVEIDLVVQGRPLFEYCRDGLPAWDYAVTVLRAAQPVRYEIYTSTLQKRLPRFRLPLAANERDGVVDLQAVFRQCYERAAFGRLIDRRNIPPFLHDRIAAAAYRLWEQEGRPHGRNKDHWARAVAELGLPSDAE
jgi:hypothetical protein